MKITCQACAAKYTIADEKVVGKIVKIRCRKCGATIVVNGTDGASANGSAQPDATAQTGAAGGGDGQWHVNLGDNDQRTLSLAELVDAYNSGVVTQETFIWTEGMDDWRPLAEVEAVVAALHASAGQMAAAASPAGAATARPVTAYVASSAGVTPINTITNTAQAVIDDSSVRSAGAVNVTANSAEVIRAVTLGIHENP